MTRRLSFAVIVAVVVAVAVVVRPVFAGEACCKKKAFEERARQLPNEEYVVFDPDEVPPSHDERGAPRFVADPKATRPSYWDDDDDGPWEPPSIPNPAFAWEPRRERNPYYRDENDSSSWWSSRRWWRDVYVPKLVDELSEAAPWVTVGVVASAVLPSVLPEALVVSSSSSSVVGAALLGLASPLCSCGALPLVAGSDAPIGPAVAFLAASQSAGLDSAAVTWGLLGAGAAALRLAGAALAAAAAGAAARSVSAAPRAPTKTKTRTASASSSSSSALRRALAATREVVPSVACGLAASVLVALRAPSLASTLEGRATTSVPLPVRALFLASTLPFQLCEHSAAALAAAVARVATPGLAHGFLIAAPATNLPSLLLLARRAGDGGNGLRAAAAASVALITAAAAWSAAVDAAVDHGVLPSASARVDHHDHDHDHDHHDHDHGDASSFASAAVELGKAASPYVLAAFFVLGTVLDRKTRRDDDDDADAKSNEHGGGCCGATTSSTTNDDDVADSRKLKTS